MKKYLLAFGALTAMTAFPSVSMADDAASPLAFNVGAVTDYRFRGISQSRKKPAIQGGIDYALPGGFYVGTWASSILWIKDYGGKTNLELDLYGGYKGEIQKDFTYDVGLLQYAYIGNKLSDTGLLKDGNTTELYGAMTYGPVIGKVSYSLTNLFGNYNFGSDKDTKGSYYVELAGTFDLGSGFSLTPHIGFQGVSHLAVANYTDYSLTVVKDLGSGFSVSLAAIGTDADKGFYIPGPGEGGTKFLGKETVVLGVKYSF